MPNLMIGFGIDEIQAEYVAEIKLRHLNREYILKRLEDIDDLKKTIEDMEDILARRSRIKTIIINELKDVIKKYGQERKTEILYSFDTDEGEEESAIPDYPVRLFLTRDGYFKKITPLSLRMSGKHKLKENDEIIQELDASNASELLFFSDKCQTYKARANDFEDTKTSVLGDYIPSKLGFDNGESLVYMAVTNDYKGHMLFFFENGKVAKVDMAAYATKTNRKKLINAYSDKSPLAAAFLVTEETDFVIKSTSGRYLLFNSGAISSKTTKNTQGVAVMTLKKGHRIATVTPFAEGMFAKPQRYKTKTLPSAGALLSAEDTGEQLSFTI